MYKFFINNSQIQNNRAYIIGEDVNHIKNVLRLQKEELLLVCNKELGNTYIAKIVEMDSHNIIVEIVQECMKTTEPSTLLHIFQGIPKQEKMEQIIQKATELGVSDITPVKMERCIVKLDEKTASKKVERWQKVAEVAAKQSKRDKIPKIHSCIGLKDVYEKVIKYDIVIIAYEEEKNTTIKQVLKSIRTTQKQKIAIIIGPEGGIAKEEIEFLKTLSNGKIVTLGRRILRTETAPLVITTLIMYELDEME